MQSLGSYSVFFLPSLLKEWIQFLVKMPPLRQVLLIRLFT